MSRATRLVKNIQRRLSNAKAEDAIAGIASMEELPSLKSVTNVAKRMELLSQKLEFCCKRANFMSDESSDKHFVTAKRKALLDLVDFLNSAGPSRGKQEYLSEAVLIEVIHMIRCNIFIALPSQMDDYDPEEDEPWLDISWPHKQVVYELLLRLVVSSDFPAKMGKKAKLIDQEFCVRLINLFESDDPRERDYLKTILHRIYGKFMSHRSFIRKQIGYVFARYVLESKRQNGISELLEILGSIINGFALPLKPEHLGFLKNSLIPLHKSPGINAFSAQLVYCITQYIDKDPSTGQLVVEKLVEYWPWSSPVKQVTFLGYLEEVLDILPNKAVFEPVAKIVFRTLARCLNSDHFQICERALIFWNNETIVELFSMDRKEDFMALNFNQIVPALLRNTDGNSPHWNLAVTMLSYSTIDRCYKTIYRNRHGLDMEVFNISPEDSRAKKAIQREEQWKQFEAKANAS